MTGVEQYQGLVAEQGMQLVQEVVCAEYRPHRANPGDEDDIVLGCAAVFHQERGELVHV
ncbi:hypothetical protein D3C80_2241690 [compost metagenome]